MAKQPIFYWDTCILLAWIKNERRQPGQMEGLRNAAKMVYVSKAFLITSVISYVEIFEADLSPEQQTKYRDLFKRHNCLPQSVTSRIAERASRMRYESLEPGPNGRRISTQDAVHLATALLYKADEFHTFDGLGENKRSGRPLLPLNGEVVVGKQKICTPNSDVLELGI